MDPMKSRGKWKSLFKKQSALNNIGLTKAITKKIKSQIKEEEEAMEQQSANGKEATVEEPPKEKEILEKSLEKPPTNNEKKTHFEVENLEDEGSIYKAIENLNEIFESLVESFFKGPITALMLFEAHCKSGCTY